MTIQLELSPAAEQRLAREAESRGLEPSEYAHSLLEQALAPSSVNNPGPLTAEKLAWFLKEMTAGMENVPPLPEEAFTRESFYSDHD